MSVNSDFFKGAGEVTHLKSFNSCPTLRCPHRAWPEPVIGHAGLRTPSPSALVTPLSLSADDLAGRFTEKAEDRGKPTLFFF